MKILAGSHAGRFAILAAALTLLRIAALIISDKDLGPDEGQYWYWSQHLAFGYYSKPPLIAWAIAATTALFGDAEWAVRLSAPLFQCGAGIFIFLLARRLADSRIGFWAGAAWLTLPGVFLSSMLATTDAPLLLFWTAALFFFFRLTAGEPGRRSRDALLLGAAIGLGLLSKYAMVYFLLGAGLAFALSGSLRRAAPLRDLLIAAAAAALIVAPNLAWNAAHDFQTIAHTADNADWSGRLGGFRNLLKFIGDQAAIAGPILLALIVAAAIGMRKSGNATTLLAFAAPAMIIVAVQATVSRAHGNWAAVAYPSLVILASMWALKFRPAAAAAKASVALHALVGLAFLAAFSSFAFADALGVSSAFGRLRGWEAQGADIVAAAKGYDAILADDREVMGELVYYAQTEIPIVAWDPNNRIDNHFEAFTAFDPARHSRLFYVTTNRDALFVRRRFAEITALGETAAPLTEGRGRVLYFFELSGYGEDHE